VSNILHSISVGVIHAVEDYCNKLGYQLIVCDAGDNEKKEKQYINVLLAKQVDGIILFPNSKNSNLYKDLLQIGYPIVFVDRKIANVPIDSVLMDNFEAVNLAMQEFIDKRYRKIGLVSPSTACQKISPRIERIKSYKQFLTNYKIKFNA